MFLIHGLLILVIIIMILGEMIQQDKIFILEIQILAHQQQVIFIWVDQILIAHSL